MLETTKLSIQQLYGSSWEENIFSPTFNGNIWDFLLLVLFAPFALLKISFKYKWIFSIKCVPIFVRAPIELNIEIGVRCKRVCVRVDHWTISNKMGTEPFILRCSKQSCVNRHWFMFSTKLSIRSGNLLVQSDQCRFKSSRFNFAIEWFYIYIWKSTWLFANICPTNSPSSLHLPQCLWTTQNTKYTYRVARNAQPKWM